MNVLFVERKKYTKVGFITRKIKDITTLMIMIIATSNMTIQDILNAFREEFVPSFGLDDNYTYYGGCPDRAVLEQWLLNTLTEFEREVGQKAFNEGAGIMDNVARKESQLEKEERM